MMGRCSHPLLSEFGTVFWTSRALALHVAPRRLRTDGSDLAGVVDLNYSATYRGSTLLSTIGGTSSVDCDADLRGSIQVAKTRWTSTTMEKSDQSSLNSNYQYGFFRKGRVVVQ